MEEILHQPKAPQIPRNGNSLRVRSSSVDSSKGHQAAQQILNLRSEGPRRDLVLSPCILRSKVVQVLHPSLYNELDFGC